jgi:hypothetical protein
MKGSFTVPIDIEEAFKGPLVDRMECSDAFWERMKNLLPKKEWQGFMGIPVHISDLFPYESEEDGKPCIVHGVMVNSEAMDYWRNPKEKPPQGPWMVRLIEYVEPKA